MFETLRIKMRNYLTAIFAPIVQKQVEQELASMRAEMSTLKTELALSHSKKFVAVENSLYERLAQFDGVRLEMDKTVQKAHDRIHGLELRLSTFNSQLPATQLRIPTI